MFLKNVKSKGQVYIYLCAYDRQEKDRKIVFSFGRIDRAIGKMNSWKGDFRDFPILLSELGCRREDLEDWIRTIETGVTKTGKQFKAII